MSKFHSKKQRKKVMSIVKEADKNYKKGKRIYVSEMNKGKTHDEAMKIVNTKLPRRLKVHKKANNLKMGDDILVHEKRVNRGKPTSAMSQRFINQSILRDR